MKNCLLCGVGGQGTVLASRILAAAAMEKGLFVRTAETIGMAQRGGSVVSHVRIEPQSPSPLIPPGTADALLGFEPGEAVRNLHYLKPGGVAVVSCQPVEPVAAAVGGVRYSGEEMLAYLKAHVERLYILDAAAIGAACGSDKVMNVALAGALAATGAIGLGPGYLLRALEKQLKPQYLEINRRALELGARAVEENTHEND
ncbi:MAG: indolepyruvate oxidoreductase subunit beta [Bacillota bacterium]|nr:indolepyruvate oxidoreductase subunit beta [Bacillota bacterium]